MQQEKNRKMKRQEMRPLRGSSWGCQTVRPDQWKAFYELVCGELRRHVAPKQEDAVFPYVLLARA